MNIVRLIQGNSMQDFFEIESGKIKKTTKRSCIHIADNNMHVWVNGISWSIHLNKKNMAEFIRILSAEDDKDADMKVSGTHVWREHLLEQDVKDNRYDIVFDAGLCRNMIHLSTKALSSFIDYLKIANWEQK